MEINLIHLINHHKVLTNRHLQVGSTATVSLLLVNTITGTISLLHQGNLLDNRIQIKTHTECSSKITTITEIISR